jgi:general secretion pathway protein D
VRLVAVHNNVASSLIPELQSIFAAYALSAKSTPLHFVPIDRINGILVVTPDPEGFAEVEKWISKLDQPAPPSGIQAFIYHVANSEADYLAKLLAGMYLEAPAAGASAAKDSGAEPSHEPRSYVRITPDPVNNSLIVQSTAQTYAEILEILKQVDILPRQVLIEARVYEVTLTGDLALGLSHFLERTSGKERKPLASFTSEHVRLGDVAVPMGLQASVGMLVGASREYLAFLTASENRSRVRVLSAPTVLATDNAEARIQVGAEVPILTSTVATGAQSQGSTLFANTVQGRDTGVILTVKPRITSTGMVSLTIAQEISTAQPNTTTTIQSPTIQKRLVTTHAVVQTGQTVALGGLIQNNITLNRNRVPLLGDLPGLGVLFGSTTRNAVRTELVVLLTPRIIQDVPTFAAGTRELIERLRELRQGFKQDRLLNPLESIPQKRESAPSARQ